ncbi:MAG TPA: hypothetical protein VK171_06755, partial [Fimbriimonas sp.]|nr:hypothetical protein [Fimbriimonas sp.]
MSVIAIASLIVTQAPVTLTFNPKVGANYKYTLTTKSDNPMMGANNTTINSTLKVLSFTNGQYKILSKFEGGSAKAGSNDLTLLVDKYGATKMSGASGPKGMEAAMSSFGSSITGIAFPKKPLKVGDTWTQEFDLGKLMSAGFN